MFENIPASMLAKADQDLATIETCADGLIELWAEFSGHKLISDEMPSRTHRVAVLRSLLEGLEMPQQVGLAVIAVLVDRALEKGSTAAELEEMFHGGE